LKTLCLRAVFAVLPAALITVSAAFADEPLNPLDAKDSVTIMRKIQCSTVDNEPVIYWWHGNSYSRRQGEKDKLIFKVEGMNIRACSTITNDKGETGFHLVSREILLYKNPKTGDVLKTWDNPWSGETVEVMHVANDPVNFKMFETGRDGKPYRWSGEVGPTGSWWMRTTVPLFYPNPLGSPYQAEVGPTYHATEMFNFFGQDDSLLDPNATTAPATVGWARMSDWLPWMKMGGREGVIYMHTAGTKLESYDQLSEVMRAEIDAHYPDYKTPPPPGDPRRNMTSWEYYKGVKEGKITLPKR